MKITPRVLIYATCMLISNGLIAQQFINHKEYRKPVTYKVSKLTNDLDSDQKILKTDSAVYLAEIHWIADSLDSQIWQWDCADVIFNYLEKLNYSIDNRSDYNLSKLRIQVTPGKQYISILNHKQLLSSIEKLKNDANQLDGFTEKQKANPGLVKPGNRLLKEKWQLEQMVFSEVNGFFFTLLSIKMNAPKTSYTTQNRFILASDTVTIHNQIEISQESEPNMTACILKYQVDSLDISTHLYNRFKPYSRSEEEAQKLANKAEMNLFGTWSYNTQNGVLMHVKIEDNRYVYIGMGHAGTKQTIISIDAQ